MQQQLYATISSNQRLEKIPPWESVFKPVDAPVYLDEGDNEKPLPDGVTRRPKGLVRPPLVK